MYKHAVVSILMHEIAKCTCIKPSENMIGTEDGSEISNLGELEHLLD